MKVPKFLGGGKLVGHTPLAAPKDGSGERQTDVPLRQRAAKGGWLPLKLKPPPAPPAPESVEVIRHPAPIELMGCKRGADDKRDWPGSVATPRTISGTEGGPGRTEWARLTGTRVTVRRKSEPDEPRRLPPAPEQTYLTKDITDVVAGKVSIHIKNDGRQRMLDSVPTQMQAALESVLEQTKESNQIAVLSMPSETSHGMASLPVTVNGEPRTAFLQFAADGRVTSVDVSDDKTFISEIEAVDAAPGQSVSASASGASAASTSALTLLTPSAGVVPRVDISSHVQRTQQDGGIVRYAYEPRGSDVLHGGVIDVRPDGAMIMQRIAVRPTLRDTLGSATDIVLGLARALNEDGMQVNQVVAEWTNTPGLESEYAKFAEAVEEGLSYRQAAMRTFTSKAARMMGFTEVDVQQSFFGHYVARFSRPSTPSER